MILNFKYKNATDRVIIYRDKIWQIDEEKETSYPVPSSLGLTCTQEGDMPDPVLFYEDFFMDTGKEKVIEIAEPNLSHIIYLTILCISSGKVECRFNGSNNKFIPIDERGFIQKMNWELCSKIFLKNSLDMSVQISVTAVEVY